MSITRSYFNNTKVANVIMKIEDFSQDIAIMEYGKKKQDVCSYINFESNDLKELKSITRFDLMVMDAVYTIQTSGRNRFTLEMLANTIAGKEISLDKNTSTKLKAIKASMDKLKKIYINIDYTSIMRENGKISQDEEYIKNGSLMPITTYTLRSQVKRKTKTAYEVLDKPVLYEYAETLGRIISVPSKILTLDGVREDTDFLAIKQQLVKEIEIMRNAKNNYRNREIKYEWANGQPGGFAERVGLKKENYSNDIQWKKRKVKLTEQLKTILDHLVSVKFIKGYDFIKEGKSIVGIAIKL